MLLKNDEDVRNLMAKNTKLQEKIDWELDRQVEEGKEPDFMQAARDSKMANPVLWQGIQIIE